MKHKDAVEIIIRALEDMKGNDILTMDMEGKTDVFDAMVIATGTSDRHVKSLADHVVNEAKKNKLSILGVEHERSWVLVDLYDVVVHVMLEEAREFYSLEKLWEISTERKKVL